jgi:SNF2 family DNA or RNA helicase
MGLGKTLTTIGTMVANPVPNTLIVLPPVLLVQWQKEILRATGKQALVYHGTQKKTIKIRELNSAEIVITTYNGIRPLKGGINLLHQVRWDRVIFDEAHHLRNANQSHEGALVLNTRIRWLITGTPIQNNIRDYFHLCAAMGLDKAIYSDKALAPNIMKTFVLKRMKKMVPSTNLPDVITHVVPVEWKEDYALAKEIHSTLPLSHVEVGGDTGKYAKHLNDTFTLQRILRAQQACTLSALLADDLKKHRIKNYNTSGSSKLDAVIDMISANKENGAGKLVFCHYRKEIDVIACRLTECGIRNATFDGRTGAAERQAILGDPNNQVIILQIQTGCEGLNLQKNYSEVYFVSPHWNPSVEQQAIGRCHRIGQEKQVYVYRFEMVGFSQQQQQQQPDDELEEDGPASISIDQYIRLVQEKKNGMTHQIMNPESIVV